MSDLSGFGLPKSRPIAPKTHKPLSPYRAQRLRFGILAARHAFARHRLTPGQVEDLEGMEAAGWRRGTARASEAFAREQDRLKVAEFWATRGV